MKTQSTEQTGLKSRNVLIDTPVYYAANFNFQSKSFSALVAAVQAERAHLYLSPITRKEVRKHIFSKTREAAAASKRFREQANILWNIRESAFQALFVRWDAAEVLKKLLKQFRTFLQSTNVRTIPLGGASAGDVFKAYFAVRPPFEARADKRSEFPDAFVLSSALSWCAKNDESMYVVSADKGMRDACAKSTRLHPLPSLESFLDLITRHDSRFADLANKIFAARGAEVLALIEQEFTAAGFVLVDQDGEVNDVQIAGATIEQVLLLSATESSAVFDVEAEIRFTADVSYADMDTAIYDSEERCLMPTRYIGRSTKPQTTTVSFEVVLDFEAHDPTEVEVGCNSVNRGKDIEVLADVDTQ